MNNTTSSITQQEKSSWSTRDGRSPTISDPEVEQFIKEHVEYIKAKTLKVEILEEMDYNITQVSQSQQTTKELEYQKGQLTLFLNVKGIPPQLYENIKSLQFQYMTPIQKIVIPYMQTSNDIMACSETGSGKTIAYLFPIIGNMLVRGPPQNSSGNGVGSPTTLILVPTRELAEQVYTESKKMCRLTGIRTVKVYGGDRMDGQLRELSEGCDILVGTPGRIIDFLKKGKISLQLINTVVIDEADRMLDMGFEDQLRTIIVDFKMPNKDMRQNLMFSATFSPEVREIAKKFLNDFFFIQPKKASPKQITQELIQAGGDMEKNSKLLNYLKALEGGAIIFLSTKRGVDSLAEHLTREKFDIASIHGDRTQWQRNLAIKNFANGKTQILIATDVASRGLDFPNVKYVFNYDLPNNMDDYIHRIGRTGRMGQKGTAVSFVTENNRPIIKNLYDFLKKQNQNIPPWFDEMQNSQGDYGLSAKRYNRFKNEWGNSNNSNDNNGMGGGKYYSQNNQRDRSRDN